MSKVVFPKAKLAIALTAALTSMSAQTLAQEQGANDANNADIERIQVEGYRGSLIKAKDIKRESVGSQDTILAEDIADFPDLNLAESLQRIPGITITREAGEGRQISLRGLNADFTQVQLNGMEALGTSSSPMDSRGGVNSSRSFDFNIFASELFNQIDVKKSYSANMDEGGIGGTVNLRTAKPFDYDGFKGAVNLQAGKNSLADDTSPRFAGLLSNTWGDFGALVSFAYSNRDTVEQGYNTYRWRPLDANGSDISALTPEQQAKVNSGELRFSRGSRYTQFNSDQTRLGTTLALQYRPSDSFNVGFDGLYGKLDNDRGEFHLQSRGVRNQKKKHKTLTTVLSLRLSLAGLKCVAKTSATRTCVTPLIIMILRQETCLYLMITLSGTWVRESRKVIRSFLTDLLTYRAPQ